MREKSLDAIMKGFVPNDSDQADAQNERKPITIWVPTAAKESYDRLQEKSGRRFSKKAREILLAAIEIAVAQAS